MECTLHCARVNTRSIRPDGKMKKRDGNKYINVHFKAFIDNSNAFRCCINYHRSHLLTGHGLASLSVLQMSKQNVQSRKWVQQSPHWRSGYWNRSNENEWFAGLMSVAEAMRSNRRSWSVIKCTANIVTVWWPIGTDSLANDILHWHGD